MVRVLLGEMRWLRERRSVCEMQKRNTPNPSDCSPQSTSPGPSHVPTRLQRHSFHSPPEPGTQGAAYLFCELPMADYFLPLCPPTSSLSGIKSI